MKRISKRSKKSCEISVKVYERCNVKFDIPVEPWEVCTENVEKEQLPPGSVRVISRASGGLSFVTTKVYRNVHFLPTFSRFFHIVFSRISQHFRVASIWRYACPPCFSIIIFLDIFQHGYPQRFAQDT